MNDTTTLIVFGVAVAVLLIGGLALNQPPPAPEPEPAPQVTVPQKTLEMLGPVYSEKGVFQDDALYISFKAAIDGDNKVESKIPVWIHNVSSDAIVILWDRCSITMQDGNTVPLVPESHLTATEALPDVITIAPGGDLFEALIPVTEITRTDGGYTLSTEAIDQGPFLLTLAVEATGDGCARTIRYYPFRLIIR
ncbi:hypothetical protein J7J55_00390 [Candidatus Bipolaricaulota bacterium]|jgi:hypothetical protein|nr:hypothetical protein [Candidatus Bipolaricaulota bacterium]